MNILEFNPKVHHPRCKLDWSLYTCLTQLYGGIDMYNLLHKEQLHVLTLFIGHLQVDKRETLVAACQCFSFINLKMANEKGRNM